MIASLLIAGFSSVLVVYWFRYSCVLLLRNATRQFGVPTDERFSIAMVLDQVGTARDLGTLERALDRDYHMLTYLLKHAADLELASIENRILILDYRLMRLWYRVTRGIAPERARKALTEMASALGAVAGQTTAQPQQTA